MMNIAHSFFVHFISTTVFDYLRPLYYVVTDQKILDYSLLLYFLQFAKCQFYLLSIFSCDLMSKLGKVHKLNLTYDEYRKMGKSISNSTIGKYVVYNEIGRGAFGAVYKGMNDQTKKMVAIKVLDLEAVEKDPSEKVKQIRRRLCKTQSQLMMVCCSDNVIACYDVYQNKSLKIMIIQFCNGGTLQEEINKKVRIPEKQAILILKQIMNGIAELHSHKIIHRDLKAENILSHNGVYKIADMGFSKQIDQNQLKQTTLGTITTMAPEVMKRQAYGLKADIWSIGVIFFQMVFGQAPYRSTNANQMYEEIKSKKILNTEQFFFNNYKASKEVTSFLKDILIVESKQRMGWKELLNHPIFRETEDRLANEFRVSCPLRGPAHTQQVQKNQEVNQHLLVKFQQSNVSNNPQELIRITQAQASLKMKELNVQGDQVYAWARLTHLQCLKTQVIYKEIIQKIEKYKFLDFQQRQTIQLMYLLSARCYNNISVINVKLKKQNKEHLYLVKNLYKTVEKLYENIQKTWKKYSDELTKYQNKFTSIVSDGFTKIFNKQSIKQKDRFLVGIENIQYTKQGQIKFTDKQYITSIINQLDKSLATKQVKNYLSHYVEINNIKQADLIDRSFEEYVALILQ